MEKTEIKNKLSEYLKKCAEIGLPDDEIKCKQCNNGYNFFIGTFITEGSDDYSFDKAFFKPSIQNEQSSFIELGSVKSKTRSRGGDTIMIFECEDCGCLWARCFSFHKGKVYTNDLVLERDP
jgi:hypothetical protein